MGKNIFNDLLNRDWKAIRNSDLLMEGQPSMAVIDSQQEVLVRAEVPGLQEKDLHISFGNEPRSDGKVRFTIEGVKQNGQGARREIRSGRFSRTILLPADVINTRPSADLKDGVLEFHFPK